jgi:pimeloyl-ACP methyl ester carboxylesterase
MPAQLASKRQRSRFLRATVERPELLCDVEGKRLVRDWLDASGYEEANVEMRSHVFEHPELVTVPATIAWGTADGLVGRPRRERMPPGARYLELEGLGHTPTWDDPPRIAELLLESSGGDQAARAQSSVESGRSSPGQAPVDA